MVKSKLLMGVSAICLLLLFIFPLWNITLEAPQYPEAIGMDIYINKIADHNPNDVKNINLMNHYVGMKDIPEHMPEFDIFPIVVIGMAVLAIIFLFVGKYKLFLVWFVLMSLLGLAGIYDFYAWEYDYGHNLSSHAAIQFTNDDGTPMAYQPPLIGVKKILNFTAISWPMLGGYLLGISIISSFFAWFIGKKEAKQ